MKKIILLFTISLLSLCAIAEDLSDNRGKLFIIPIAGYANDTNFVGGGLVYYTYRPENRPYDLMPDAHYITTLISLNKQWEVSYRSSFFLYEDRYYISPQFDYELWPSSFYGLGNNTLEDDKEKYTKNHHSLSLNINRTLNNRISTGIIIEYDRYRLSDIEADKMLSKKIIPGSEKFNLNSLGSVISYDTRDFALYPSSGSYHQFEIKQALKIVNGDYSFTSYTLDYRRYFTPHNKGVFAFQGYLSFIDGEAPFQKLNNLGSEVRGYDANRYIDDTMIIMRGEYRIFPWSLNRILSRLGGVLFVESGQVATNINSLKASETKISYGFGLRIALVPLEKLNLRFDIGFSKDVVDIVVTTYEIF